MTGLTAEGEASECGLGTGGTLAKGAKGPWDFSSREGKGWLDGPTRTHYLRSGNDHFVHGPTRTPLPCVTTDVEVCHLNMYSLQTDDNSSFPVTK